MAKINFNNTCLTCIYYSDPNQIMGTCRRYPTYQNRHSTEWCGEFELNPSPVAIENIVQDVTRESIMAEVSAIKTKPGRPKKDAS